MPKYFNIRSKIWIEDKSGEVVFGPGRMKIFEAIERLGSIHAAGKELGMGYKAIWNRIKATEERLGEPLLIRNAAGSRLTPFAEKLIQRFRCLQESVITHSDECFEKDMDRWFGSSG